MTKLHSSTTALLHCRTYVFAHQFYKSYCIVNYFAKLLSRIHVRRGNTGVAVYRPDDNDDDDHDNDNK